MDISLPETTDKLQDNVSWKGELTSNKAEIEFASQPH